MQDAAESHKTSDDDGVLNAGGGAALEEHGEDGLGHGGARARRLRQL